MIPRKIVELLPGFRAIDLGGTGRGGGTPPGFGYALEKGAQDLWLSTLSRLENSGAVTDPRTLRRGLLKGANSVGAVVFDSSDPRKASWISHSC